MCSRPKKLCFQPMSLSTSLNQSSVVASALARGVSRGLRPGVLLKKKHIEIRRGNANVFGGEKAAAAKIQTESKAFLAPSADLIAKAAPSDKPVYLDYQATTPCDPRVVQKMLPFFSEVFGNAHSRTHAYGWEAEARVEEARGHIATLIGAQPREIIFTSGATESNNLAIKGAAQYYGKHRGKKHAITVQTEHKCVLASHQWLETEMGWDVTYLPVGKDGLVDPKAVEAAIRDDTCHVSVMLVNNEIGVIQPIKEISDICRRKGVLLHCDAAQACGKMPVDVNDLGVDLLSLSAHKMYGPKGIGALFVRSKPRCRLMPQISGGGQERGLRSGTLAVPLCVGMGEAARLAALDMEQDRAKIKALAKRFIENITSRLEGVELNGSATQRLESNCNLSFACVEGESLLMAMKNVAVSSGSACTSASLEPSYVLRAIGVNEELAHTSIRFGLGRFTTEQEVDYVADAVVEAVTKLRSLSPLWEAQKEGSNVKMVWT
eukprot:Blabericola_migrator_1__12988@NODE_865_length_6229_cov_246_540571_g613_i0_p2_GENE_NODE_865_length_6229_cov_246_540571_g613_i0NODE_865_length_6229_cov_246_540571_g613_i0_p2_ORF_typecomplete_len492_score65_98Aminotran_5/PF00266_19/1_6e109Pyridoxal_deC/PF00282_19/6_7e18Beta_elim_lyase/PF01212_21/9_3e13DegT_DnrJ_EryC1/PF01041_17/4_1e11OKR_DC_1/PF01276_20/1_6e07OKR_DC_1/PF01276_20/4_7e02Cys_Met_Meta_PP/PF01053_20/1_9e07Cys_Met_Meta_PP/PF01053_20/7_2e03Aminotran_1_2/PF00155_21/5e07SelA/PF03841_13/1_3e